MGSQQLAQSIAHTVNIGSGAQLTERTQYEWLDAQKCEWRMGCEVQNLANKQVPKQGTCLLLVLHSCLKVVVQHVAWHDMQGQSPIAIRNLHAEQTTRLATVCTTAALLDAHTALKLTEFVYTYACTAATLSATCRCTGAEAACIIDAERTKQYCVI